jgi:hypothetical protein
VYVITLSQRKMAMTIVHQRSSYKKTKDSGFKNAARKRISKSEY